MDVEDTSHRIDAIGDISRLKTCRTVVTARENALPVGQTREWIGKWIGILASTLLHPINCLVATGLIKPDRQASATDSAAMPAVPGFTISECCADVHLLSPTEIPCLALPEIGVGTIRRGIPVSGPRCASVARLAT